MRIKVYWFIGRDLNTELDAVSCLMATRDGECFVSGCRDGSIKVFEIEMESCAGGIEKAHQGIER